LQQGSIFGIFYRLSITIFCSNFDLLFLQGMVNFYRWKVSGLLVFLFIQVHLYATHERAGEITYRHISGYTYEITLITYTYRPSPADRPELEIKWGDGTSAILPRVNPPTDLTQYIRRNVYIGQHTYSGQGIFKISIEDPNRNYGIINIPNSVNIPFYIETELVIHQWLGSNNSVVLLNPPLDYGCVNRLYIHNPAAYDPDGDSISYKLTICKGLGGMPIPGYQYPAASNIFTIDALTGDLIWDKPTLQGEYNVAFIIEEWRAGVRMGYVTRDLQIKIDACDNNPPVINCIDDTCITANETLSFEIEAVDPDGDMLYLYATGGPFLQNLSPAQIEPDPASGIGNTNTQFNWTTKCDHVRKNPYPAYFKAIDSVSPGTVALSSYKTVNITVVGPEPEMIEAIPLGTSIKVSWNNYECDNALGFYLYRSDSYFNFTHGYCETGVPAYTGFKKIAEIKELNTTIFTDDNNGNGLIHGIEYCYMITAFFSDGAESYASNEVCATLKKDIPIITNVSVDSTSISDGKIYIAWSKPTELDTILIPGPYEYRLFRKDSSPASEFSQIAVFDNLNDTLFHDTFLNTRELQYRYKIDFYNLETGNSYKIGSTVAAPSVFLEPEGTDRSILLDWNNDVPWTNELFTIYRKNELTSAFDPIGWSEIPFYADTGLINGKEYTYKIKTSGKYSAPGLIKPIINFSQINSGKPVDNVPPCPPVLSVDVNCEELINHLTWTYPDTCVIEELIFYIYYSAAQSLDYLLIDSTTEYSYTFKTNPPSVVGCFTITALDSLRNQSLYSNVRCIDIYECGRIWFPIVFTPNADNFNDFFEADSVNSIHHLDLRIFNRWGTIVFDTEDPFFKWNGMDEKNNRECSPGVYFYEGIVSEYTLQGPVERKVRGSVTLLR
jgi:gliding motility-associated-like protein